MISFNSPLAAHLSRSAAAAGGDGRLGERRTPLSTSSGTGVSISIGREHLLPSDAGALPPRSGSAGADAGDSTLGSPTDFAAIDAPGAALQEFAVHKQRAAVAAAAAAMQSPAAQPGRSHLRSPSAGAGRAGSRLQFSTPLAGSRLQTPPGGGPTPGSSGRQQEQQQEQQQQQQAAASPATAQPLRSSFKQQAQQLLLRQQQQQQQQARQGSAAASTGGKRWQLPAHDQQQQRRQQAETQLPPPTQSLEEAMGQLQLKAGLADAVTAAAAAATPGLKIRSRGGCCCLGMLPPLPRHRPAAWACCCCCLGIVLPLPWHGAAAAPTCCCACHLQSVDIGRSNIRVLTIHLAGQLCRIAHTCPNWLACAAHPVPALVGPTAPSAWLPGRQGACHTCLPSWPNRSLLCPALPAGLLPAGLLTQVDTPRDGAAPTTRAPGLPLERPPGSSRLQTPRLGEGTTPLLQQQEVGGGHPEGWWSPLVPATDTPATARGAGVLGTVRKAQPPQEAASSSGGGGGSGSGKGAHSATPLGSAAAGTTAAAAAGAGPAAAAATSATPRLTPAQDGGGAFGRALAGAPGGSSRIRWASGRPGGLLAAALVLPVGWVVSACTTVSGSQPKQPAGQACPGLAVPPGAVQFPARCAQQCLALLGIAFFIARSLACWLLC